MISSDNWFERVKAGDERAFRQVFDRYYRPVTFFATKILRDDMDAEDVASDSFRKVWDAREKFETPRHLENFLYLVTRNGCISHLRAERRIETTYEEWSRLADEAIGNATTLDKERVQVLLIKTIYQKMEALPGGDVLRMSYIEGKSTEAIAEELNTTENNVYILKSRALKALRKALTDGEWMFFLLVFLKF